VLFNNFSINLIIRVGFVLRVCGNPVYENVPLSKVRAIGLGNRVDIIQVS